MIDDDHVVEARRAQDKLDQLRETRYQELASWVRALENTLATFQKEVNTQYIELRSLIIGVSTREGERHNFTHWLRENAVILLMIFSVGAIFTIWLIALEFRK